MCIDWYGIIIDVNKIIFLYIYMSEQKVHQLTSSQKKALADGKTTRHFSRGLHGPSPTLRQRAMYPDEQGESGDALYIAREKGLLTNIKEFGNKREAAKPIIKAIGKRDAKRFPIKRIRAKDGKVEIPSFLTRKIKSYDEGEISDLTKTGFGAKSQRKSQGRERGRRKTPQSAGKRKKTRRKRRKRKSKKNRKSRKKKKSRKRRRRK